MSSASPAAPATWANGKPGDGNVRKMFDACDSNQDGLVSVQDLCDWMQKLGLHITNQGLLEIVRSAIPDKKEEEKVEDNGRILSSPNGHEFSSSTDVLSFPQFVEVSKTLNLEGGDSQDRESDQGETLEAFRLYDKDGNGLISPPELRSTLSELGLMSASASFSRIHSMIRRVDADGDGQVNFSEFQSMLNRSNNACS